MNETRLCALGQLKAFLEGTGEIRFQSVGDDEGRYSHIQAVLKRFAYPRLKRADKGLVLRYLGRTTGYSRQQLTRLVRQCSGPATKHLMQRALLVFWDTRYARLAFISVAHLYNLRAAAGYRSRRQHWAKTRPTGIPIGERRAPQPDGHPGYLRIDSVHQGDEDGVKGVYHINDEKEEQATRAAFELPAGEWIVWAAAIGIAGYGVYQLYRARRRSMVSQAPASLRSTRAAREPARTR